MSRKKTMILLGFGIVLGLGLLLFGLLKKDYIVLKYQEDNSVNYKVFLKPNDYFESEFLGENRTYIATLIDYLDIDYQYLVNFSENVTGSCEYYIKAGSEQIQKVDYDEYNQILNDFKKEYSMQTDGELVVSLIVDGIVAGDIYKDDVVVNSDLTLSIPMLQQTVEASIEKNATSVTKDLSMRDHRKQFFYYACDGFGSLLMIGSIILFIMQIIDIIRDKKKDLYEDAVNKIISSHDSIIADVVKLPNMNGFKIINISTFDELLDVYNEVRMPINFHKDEKKKESIFLIINDGVAWQYKISKKDFKIKKGSKKTKK